MRKPPLLECTSSTTNPCSTRQNYNQQKNANNCEGGEYGNGTQPLFIAFQLHHH